MLIRVLPIWEIGFMQDDSVASSWRHEGIVAGQSVFGYCHGFLKSMIEGQGRFVPGYCYLLLPILVLIEDNLLVYRLIQTTAQLLAMGSFVAFAAKLTRDWWTAGLSLVLFIAIYEIRDFHDPAFGQFITFPFLIILGCLACHQALICSETSGRSSLLALTWVTLLNGLAILTLDYAIPFALLACILLLTGTGKWMTRAKHALIAGLPVLVMMIIGIILRSQASSLYTGTSIGSLELGIVARTYWGQLVSALPLSYLIFDPQHFFEESWFDRQHLLPAGVAALAAFAATFYAARRAIMRCPMRTILAGAVLLLTPPLLISFSLKYQQQTTSGLGYVQTVFSYLGFSLVLAFVFDLIARSLIRWRRIHVGVLFLLAGGAALSAGSALLGSYRVADKINAIWRYPREILEVWLHARQESVRPDECYIVNRGWLNRWENFYFLAQHTGKPGRFVTQNEASSNPSVLGPRDNIIQLRYPFRAHPTDLALVLANFVDPAPSSNRLSAFVISRDKGKLAGSKIRLLRANESWEFPPEISVGRNGYYFRRLHLNVDSISIDDYLFGIQ